MLNGLRSAAIEYAESGWRVFPLNGKRPIISNGFKGATIDAATLDRWWSRWPNAGIGIATGAESGLVVLDVDPRHDGDESLIELEAKHGVLPETPVSLTGGGGAHYLFAHPGPSVPCRTALGGYSGIDLKADGGYIVAPPSIHPNGRSYEWNAMLHPDDVPLAPCPSVLIELARAGGPERRYAYRAGAWNGKIPPRVLTLVRSDARIRARFRRDPARLHDTSPSGVDFALAATLARRGLSGAEIEAAIRASRAQAKLPDRRETYFAATVGKALGGARA